MSLSGETILTDIYDAWRAHNLDLLATYLSDDFSHFINVPTEMHPLGEVRHVDLAPTLAALLGIDPPVHAVGQVLAAALARR